LGIRDVILQEVSDSFDGGVSVPGQDQPTGGDSLDSDTGVVAGAGLRGIVPIGDRVYWSAEVVPEYVWWRENEDRNREQINADLAVDVFLGRLELRAAAARQEALERLSSESQLFVSRRTDSFDAELAVELASAIYAFGQARTNEIRSNENDVPEIAPFAQDDRDEEILVYGLRYRPTDPLTIAVGVEDLTLDFTDSARDRSAAGESPFVAVTLNADRTLVIGRLVRRDLEPAPGSLFGGYDELSGELDVHRRIGWRAAVDLGVSRDIFFALEAESSHFESDRLRGGVTFELLRFLDLRLFSGVGDDEYFAVSSQSVNRVDDVTEWGVGLSWDIEDRVTLVAGYTHERYDSDLTRSDRDADRVQLALSLSAWGGRLSVR